MASAAASRNSGTRISSSPVAVVAGNGAATAAAASLANQQDSDYEDGGNDSDETLDIAKRTYNVHTTEAHNDGFREGFDKGQVQVAQEAYNTSHSKSASAQLPYGIYHGLVKILKHTHPQNKQFQDFIKSSSSSGVTRASLMERLDALDCLEIVRSSQLSPVVSQIRTQLSQATTAAAPQVVHHSSSSSSSAAAGGGSKTK